LMIKNPALRARLGELATPMLIGMTERGPDSAGLAVFTEPAPGEQRKFSLYSGAGSMDWASLRVSAVQDLGSAALTVQANHAILSTTATPELVRMWLGNRFPTLHLLSVGRRIDLYKDIGAPAAVAERYDFAHLSGTHVVAHTRMATESAVTPAHAHPFTAGEDFCLVHNGSLSNPYQIRRKLEPRGIVFETDNDTEAATRFLEWRMREGDDLETALRNGFDELDGFYTFLMGTVDSLALVRDAFACKPAIVAETDDYVAVSSEFRSLAGLPGVKHAHLFEPKPEELYVWRA